MIPKNVEKIMNEQINKELASAYLYLSMAAYFESKNLSGFGNWMRVQAEEEYEHAMKFYEHIVDRGGRVVLTGIESPQVEWKNNLEVVKEVLKHEEFVTASINAIYDLAVAEKDYPAQVMLQWFIDEQVEEEKNAGELVFQVESVGENSFGLLSIDHRLAERKAD